MPLYDCKCEAGHQFERQIPLAQFEEPIICSCGEVAHRCISKPRVLRPVDYSYDCPITGKHITTKRAHEDNLKRHGCRVLETGEKEFNERERAKADAALERAVDQTVEREIALMPSDKRERLSNELDAGVSAEVIRR